MEGCTIVLSDCHSSTEEEADHRALGYGWGGWLFCNNCEDDDA